MASSSLCSAPIYLDDTASITVPEMKARLRRMKDLGFVVVDYLQLMQSAKKTDNRVQEVSDITRSLKIMAKELDVPVMICAQLSRGTEKQGNHRGPPCRFARIRFHRAGRGSSIVPLSGGIL